MGPEINISKISVGGDFGGLVFAVGCVAITLIGVPALRPVMLASLALGALFAIGLAGWHRRHPLHHRSLRIGILLLSIGLYPSASSAQPPDPVRPSSARPTSDAASNTRTIRGRVTTADSGVPVRRARITATRAGAYAGSAVTDEDGRYALTQLPPGRFRVTASKTTLATMAFGQRHPNAPGRDIDLTTDKGADHVDIALPRGGVIAGRIVDDIGEPAAYTRVAALRVAYSEGRRQLEPTGRIVTTDDLGQYRLAGLPPGRYAVGTTPSPADSAANLAASYYPGTQDMAAASMVALTLAGDVAGIDFAMLPGGLARLQGTVMDDRGRPATHARVGLVSSSSGGVSSSQVQRDGSFTLTNVAPGDYGLFASGTNPETHLEDICMTPISVQGDMDGIALRIDGGYVLNGVVTTDDGSMPGFAPGHLRVGTVPLPKAGAMWRPPSAGSGAVRPDWTFALSGLAGTMRLTVEPLPDGWMLKQVLAGQDDLSDDGVTVTKNGAVDDLRIIITRKTTEISGAVTEPLGHPVLDYVAVLFPVDRDRWTTESRYVATAQPDSEGRFMIKKLPPGKYLAVALDYLEEDAWQDPDILESLQASATKVTLDDGGHVTLSLPLTVRR